MPTPDDFKDRFAACRTNSEVNDLYQTIYREHRPNGEHWAEPLAWQAFSEAGRRRAEELCVELRDELALAAARPPKDGRLRGHIIKNWAMGQGIPYSAKGRPTVELENKYRAAVGMELWVPPIKEEIEAEPLPPEAPTPAEVRVWAAESGIIVSPRGKVPLAVIAQYEAALSRKET